LAKLLTHFFYLCIPYPVNGKVKGQSWFKKLALNEHYIYKANKSKCLSKNACKNTGDVREAPYKGWKEVARACGQITRKSDIVRPGNNYCDIWQIVKLVKGKGKKRKQKLLLTMTYSQGASNPTCPTELVFEEQDILAAGYGGAAQFVLQQAYPDSEGNPVNLFDTSLWECKA